MATSNLIAAAELCSWHQVEYTFITSLHDAGLITVQVINHEQYIPESEISRIEKMIRLHHDLEINVAGIGAITHLLERVETMQEELRVLRNRQVLNW